MLDGDDKDKLEYIQKVLTAVKRKDTRYTNAVKRRTLLKGYLARNEAPEGMAKVRYEFIKDSAQKVLGLLAQLGTTFNTAYSDDLATIQDMLDIIATVRAELNDRS